MRMEKFEKEFIERPESGSSSERAAWEKTMEGCREGKAIHCVFPAGCAVVAATCVEEIEDAQWRDLGMPETLWHAESRNLDL